MINNFKTLNNKYIPLPIQTFSLNVVYIFLGLLLILSSCEFSPDEIAERIVERPSEIAPTLEYELTPETDTLWLADPVSIKYQFKGDDGKVLRVDFSFDETLLFQREYDLDQLLSFDLNPHAYREGLHELKITVYTSSNTGSIADKLHAEGYMYELKWPVLIDFTSPGSGKILSITKKPGGALIKWEKFAHPSFKNYTLEKNASFDHSSKYVAVIRDQDSTEYFDADYLEGENVYYRLYLNGYGGNGIEYSVPPGPITATWTSGYSAKVKWEPTQNPRRLNYYRLFQRDRISPQDEKHIAFGTNELIFDKLPLGSNVQINLQNVPKTTTSNFSFDGLQTATATVAIGDQIPVHEVSKKVTGTNFSLMANGNKLILYDHENRLRVDSLDFGTTTLRAYRISPDGKVVFTLLAGNNFQAWEITGFNLLGSVNILDISNSLGTLFDISVSSDFKILFVLNGEKVLVYDFNAQKILIAPDKIIGWSKISPDGKHVMSRFTQYDDDTYYRYYQIESNQLVLKGESVYPGSTWGNLFFFSRQDADQMIICHDSEVQVRKASDFSLINTFKVSYYGFNDYDPETNTLAWKNPSSECNLFKIPTGEITKTVYLSGGSVILHRDYLIGRNGRQLNISDL